MANMDIVVSSRGDVRSICARTTTRALDTTTTNILSPLPRRKADPGQQFDDQNGPGELSSSGPRHDNDYMDFRLVKILPTPDEVLYVDRPQYMPKKNIQESHFLPPGPLRLLDIHFRHLRYDSTESLRDILYAASQLSFLGNYDTDRYYDEPVLETCFGNRYHLYSNLCIEGLVPHEKKGIIVRFSFDCPTFLKGHLMHKSTRLESGMLCALLLLEKTTQQLSIIYFDIHRRESTFSMRAQGGHKSRAAVQLAFHSDTSHDDVLQITRLAHGLYTNIKLALVEFPKALYLSFFNPLHRLQQMKPSEIAFHQYLAPSVQEDPVTKGNYVAQPLRNFVISPPWYTKGTAFAYNLSPISATKASLDMESLGENLSRSAVEEVVRSTTLDKGQAVALCSSLSRELAFTQGPPGTGKTFLGVALTRVLLASRHNREKKPIIVVCLTNHALDSFMGGLRDASVENLLRIGNGSKEEWTEAINLFQKSKNQHYKGSEKRDAYGLASQKNYSFSELSAWCDGITGKVKTSRVAWLQIKPILRDLFPESYSQLVTATDNIAIQAFTFDYWAGGGDLNHLCDLQEELSCRLVATLQHQSKPQPDTRSNLPEESNSQQIVEDLISAISAYTLNQSAQAGANDLWQLSYESRQVLVAGWSQHVDENASAKDLAYLHSQYRDLISAEQQLRDKKHLRTLAKQDVIGLTTTACAGRWELLRALGPEILICEEAGEVMEAHALCALLPSIKHGIFIGDPLQLRPQVKERTMTLETLSGIQYRLDESLFERFMFPRDPEALVMPTSQLNIQRRMHPQIADISRLTYPFLEDHESTVLHPPAKGLTERMFWLDHRIPEATEPETSDSVFNMHEVEMTKALVRYLLRGSEYSLGDIAVLTPYAAQLTKLVGSLQATCSIWLCESDKDVLLDSGQLDPELERVPAKTDVKMEEMLRCATVDNFQGEEAKIIILSTVRSGSKPGFLKTSNRINVACSRARDGFFIIGNAETLSQVPMWRDIMNVFDRGSRRGQVISLQCPRHPTHTARARDPSDFERFEVCSHVCGAILDCGHACQEGCHDLALHDRIPCSQSCNKVLNCGHYCNKKCAESCGTCMQSATEVELECGHVGLKLCSGQITDCDQVVETRKLSCGIHNTDVICGQQDRSYTCSSRCATILSCAHQCPGTCQQCDTTKHHQECTKTCERRLNCGHICTATCHGGKYCPPCQEPCQNRCSHGQCKNCCAEPCDPCTEINIKDNDVTRHPSIICSLQGRDTATVKETLDRLLLKMALRLNDFITQLNLEAERLDRGFTQWNKLIRPNPLAADANIRLVMNRANVIVGLQRKIVGFRNTVVGTIETSMKFLHEMSPRVIPKYTILFHLRFDALEYRAISIRIFDKLRVIRHLLRIQDPSKELHRQVLRMLHFIVTECLACAKYCQAAIDDHRLFSNPYLECETRLYQVQFHLLAYCAYHQLHDTNITVIPSASPISKPRLLQSLARVEAVSKHYPLTNKGFLDVCAKYQDLLISKTQPDKTSSLHLQVPPVRSVGGLRVERVWGKHELGHLVTTCENKHPYSKVTFPNGCPECGQWSESDEQLCKKAKEQQDLEVQAAKEHLHENDFLAMIETMTTRNAPSPKKELTPEEKFFAAMKKKFG